MDKREIRTRLEEQQRKLDMSAKYSHSWVACINRIHELQKLIREAKK